MSYVRQGKKVLFFEGGPDRLNESLDESMQIVESIDDMDTEIISERVGNELVERKVVKNGLWVVEGPFQRSDTKNANGRTYARKIWERLIGDDKGDVQTRVRERAMVGHVEHPADGRTHLLESSMLTTLLKLREDGVVWGAAELLDTPGGRVLQELTAKKVKWGVSSRGNGTVDSSGKVNEADYQLDTFDAVSRPSTPGAFPLPKSKIKEGSVDEGPQLKTLSPDEALQALQSYIRSLEEKSDDEVTEAIKDLLSNAVPYKYRSRLMSVNEDTQGVPDTLTESLLTEAAEFSARPLDEMDRSEQLQFATNLLNKWGQIADRKPNAKSPDFHTVLKQCIGKLHEVNTGLCEREVSENEPLVRMVGQLRNALAEERELNRNAAKPDPELEERLSVALSESAEAREVTDRMAQKIVSLKSQLRVAQGYIAESQSESAKSHASVERSLVIETVGLLSRFHPVLAENRARLQEAGTLVELEEVTEAILSESKNRNGRSGMRAMLAESGAVESGHVSRTQSGRVSQGARTAAGAIAHQQKQAQG